MRTVILTQDEIDLILNLIRSPNNGVQLSNPDAVRLATATQSVVWKLTGPIPTTPTQEANNGYLDSEKVRRD